MYITNSEWLIIKEKRYHITNIDIIFDIEYENALPVALMINICWPLLSFNIAINFKYTFKNQHKNDRIIKCNCYFFIYIA